MGEVTKFPGGPTDPPTPPPVENAPATSDPVQEAIGYSDYATKTFMATVAKLVRYQDYCKTMKIDRFQAALRLCLYDQFTSLPDPAKARKISTPNHSFKEADLERIRRSDEYPRLQADVLKVIDLLCDPSSVDRLAEVMEDANAMEMFRLAHFAPSMRDRQAALREFVDRRSAKKTRDVGGKEMILPERFVEQLMAGAAAMMAIMGQAGQSQISGSELNVPRLVGEGRASE